MVRDKFNFSDLSPAQALEALVEIAQAADQKKQVVTIGIFKCAGRRLKAVK